MIGLSHVAIKAQPQPSRNDADSPSRLLLHFCRHFRFPYTLVLRHDYRGEA